MFKRKKNKKDKKQKKGKPSNSSEPEKKRERYTLFLCGSDRKARNLIAHYLLYGLQKAYDTNAFNHRDAKTFRMESENPELKQLPLKVTVFPIIEDIRKIDRNCSQLVNEIKNYEGKKRITKIFYFYKGINGRPGQVDVDFLEGMRKYLRNEGAICIFGGGRFHSGDNFVEIMKEISRAGTGFNAKEVLRDKVKVEKKPEEKAPEKVVEKSKEQSNNTKLQKSLSQEPISYNKDLHITKSEKIQIFDDKGKLIHEFDCPENKDRIIMEFLEQLNSTDQMISFDYKKIKSIKFLH